MQAQDLRPGQLVSVLREWTQQEGGVFARPGEVSSLTLRRISWTAFKNKGIARTHWAPSGSCSHEYTNRGQEGTILRTLRPFHPDGARPMNFWDGLTHQAQLTRPTELPSTQENWVFVFGRRTGHSVNVRCGVEQGFLYAWSLYAYTNKVWDAGGYLDSDNEVWVRPVWPKLRDTAVWLVGDQPCAPLVVLPGVVHSVLSSSAWDYILTNGGRVVQEMLYAAFMTAANAAKRSGTPEGAKLFLEGNQSGGEGQPVVVANSGDWAPLIHHRQREFTDLGCRLNAQVQQWETQARVYRDRLANVEHLVLDPTKELQPLLDEGILEGVKFDGAGTWLKMAPIVVKCEEARYDGRDYPSGTFEIPSAVVHVPVEGPGQLKILDAASGERHEHPHVRMGPEHRGLPCWGETEEIKLRNESRAEDLWFSSPKDFVYFLVGFMSSVYDEGNGSYPPFQHWCRRVDEPQSGA